MNLSALDEHVRACQAGQTDRFAEVVKASESAVRGVLAAMVPDPDAVPDLAQEVFLTAYEKLDTYRPGSNFLAWIRAIARHTAQNERRRWYRRQEMQRRYQADLEQQLDDPVREFVDSLPEEVLASLRGCVDGLGGRTKSLVDGFYFEGRPLQRLADALQLSTGAAKVALHRARAALGKCLGRKGGS